MAVSFIIVVRYFLYNPRLRVFLHGYRHKFRKYGFMLQILIVK